MTLLSLVIQYAISGITAGSIYAIVRIRSAADRTAIVALREHTIAGS